MILLELVFFAIVDFLMGIWMVIKYENCNLPEILAFIIKKTGIRITGQMGAGEKYLEGQLQAAQNSTVLSHTSTQDW